jgi:hypothetical protein
MSDQQVHRFVLSQETPLRPPSHDIDVRVARNQSLCRSQGGAGGVGGEPAKPESGQLGNKLTRNPVPRRNQDRDGLLPEFGVQHSQAACKFFADRDTRTMWAQFHGFLALWGVICMIETVLEHSNLSCR